MNEEGFLSWFDLDRELWTENYFSTGYLTAITANPKKIIKRKSQK